MMQDRFLQRFWHSGLKQMLEVHNIDYSLNLITAREQRSQGLTEFHISEGELMQCTGLPDKNNNLIYDKDIVEDGLGHTYIIEWFKGGFWVNGGQNGATWNIHMRHDGLKIIGNIHEQPELLKTEVPA